MVRKGGPREFQQKPLKLDSSALSPFFERFFIFSGPRGFWEKKLQKIDSMQLEGRSSWILALHVIAILL
jgi:hypothetical protein